MGNTQRFFASRGYAMVRIDVRGSGASFGRWSGPSSSDEVKDGGEIVNWIVAQPWSNGKVGAMGDSYEGSTAQMLAAVNHPAVKAVIPRFMSSTFTPTSLFQAESLMNGSSGHGMKVIGKLIKIQASKQWMQTATAAYCGRLFNRARRTLMFTKPLAEVSTAMTGDAERADGADR